MATSLGEAIVKFTSQFSGFTAGVNAVTAGMREVSASMKQAQSFSAQTSAAMNSFGASTNSAWSNLRNGLHMEVGRSPGLFSSMVGGIKNAIGGTLDFASKMGMAIFGIQQFGQGVAGMVTGLF